MNYDFIFNNIVWIILTILVFWFIIFIHELGHFLSAKLFGVKVEEFGMWLPPRIARLFKDKSWTIYSLNLLPIGWFVSLKWEKYDEQSVYEKDSLAWANIFKQMIIVLAWVGMNFLLACVIFSVLFTIWVQPLYIDSKLQVNTHTKLILTIDEAINQKILKVSGLILSPIKWSIAEEAWIKEKDVLIAINWKKVTKPEEMINAVKYFDSPLTFTIIRKDSDWIAKENNIQLNPENGKIWTYIDYNYIDKDKNFTYKYPLGEAIKIWFQEWVNQTKYIFEWLKTIVLKIATPKTNLERSEAISTIGWPISLWSLFIDLISFKANLILFVIIAALLSLNLAIFNLLPIPALDWWRFFIMLVNGFVILIFGRKAIDERTETFIHIFWYFLLIWLSIYIAYMDIFKLFTK